MFYTKEEKANFKLENESQLNVHHFLMDIYIYKVTNRKPCVNIISENNIGPLKTEQSSSISLPIAD